ncbi:FKBP-type peptidyl-prolyl cis-trans isomerase [Erythrobacter sp. JK5]|uniref:FKBP-type peptidyl-prolyl cis-trans isomerase n=1 Tax=Erythrobacter sp. JK5 TaxID=2829500 RepID=UPI001BA61AE4|nr:FKBP-type peptidyl-prolyl cis-trans isomerase [Erythrobacter sp. JK5]QUL36628.1 FKBP-type peptidyl-prolyl cis-trans isomerase [Erythrobacter sp. JK5]
MAEVTRVPIHPIAKGSLTKLWLGVIVAILLGGGLAWAALPKSFSMDTIAAGEGASPQVGDMAFVKYTGKLADTGEVFDESQDIPLPIEGIFPEGTPFPVEDGATIPGFFKGLQQMQKGGKYELFIPAEDAYGAEEKADPQTGEVRIPANSDLVFEVELVDFMSRQEFDRNLAILQQALQQQMPGGPGPGGPGGPPPSAPPEGAPAQPQGTQPGPAE